MTKYSKSTIDKVKLERKPIFFFSRDGWELQDNASYAASGGTCEYRWLIRCGWNHLEAKVPGIEEKMRRI